MPPIRVTELGKDGVILDLHPLQPDLPVNALANAQNATHDPKSGHGGALRKRAGLVQFGSVAAGGSVLGGIGMPVAGTGGAAVAGTGSTGSGAGAGDGTGAPGSTTDGADGNAGAPAGAGQFDGGSTIFSGARLVVIAMDTNNVNDGYGWYVTSHKFQNASLVVTTPGPPGAADNTGYSAGAAKGKPCVMTTDGWFYYPVAKSESGAVALTIRRTNGTLDQLVGSIAPLANPSDKPIAMCMAYGGGRVFVGVRDTAYNASPQTGRLVTFDHTSLTQTTVGTWSAHHPYCMVWVSSLNRLFIGLNPEPTTLASSAGRLDAWSVASGTPVQVYASGAYAWNSPFTMAVCEFDGCLYVGSITDSAGSGDSDMLRGAAFDNLVLGGIDTASLSGVTGGDMTTYRGETMGDAAGVYDLREFNNRLVISWYSDTRVAILTAEGVTTGTPGLTNFTARYTQLAANGRYTPLALFEDNGVLYAIGSDGLTGTKAAFLYSEDGVTWTDATATVAVGSPATAYPDNMLAGFEQA